jgi:ABC-type Mn2+/Zn2+ transport system ATPase subunit
MMTTDPARLDIDSITVQIGSNTVLDKVSFSVPHGARVAVVGPNGAGKSTLFKTLVGLLPLTSGRILIHNLPIGHHLDCVAYVPQREEVDWRFPVTVRDAVMMGRYGSMGWLRNASPADNSAVDDALTSLKIRDIASRPIQRLSGGQQQRVFLARALAQEPHILLMDEPFTGVDSPTQEITLALLDELQAACVTTLISTHDLNLARERFDHVLLLNHSLIAYGSPAEVFTRENIQSAFHSQVMVVDGAMVVDQCCGGEDLEHRHTHSQVEQ